MCDIALDYVSENNIKFNPLKCQMINYSENRNIVFNLDGVGTDLGHIIGPNICSNIMQDASYALRRVKYVLNNFIPRSYNVKCQL